MADETDLVYGSEAHIVRVGQESTDSEFEAYLFHRKNPKGVHIERWRHAFGCGKWFHAVRCTLTMEVFGTYSAQILQPPQHICEAIVRKYPDWSWEQAS